MSMTIESSAFGPGQAIPTKYTGEGEDVSPPLSWKDVPAGTNAALNVNPGIDKAGLLAVIGGHVLAEADLIGTYER